MTLPPPPPYGPPAHYQQPVGTNGFAITSLCLGILPICAGIPAVIFGIVALTQIHKSRQKGKGLAIGGLCAVGLWWIGGLIAFLLGIIGEADRDSMGQITGAGDVPVYSLRVGDCVKEIKESRSLTDVPAVPCTAPHTGEVVGEFTLSDAVYPGEDAITTQAMKQCELLLDGYTSRGDEVQDLYFVFPRFEDWAKGSRAVTCIASFTTPQTGSLRG